MKDICVLYNIEDVEDFANFLKQLFERGDNSVEISFKNISDASDLKEIASYKVVVFLCSPCMIEFFDDELETEKFQKCLKRHTCVVCFQYYVEDDDIQRLQSGLSLTNGWKLFQKLSSTEECKETIGDIFDILEEQSKLKPELIAVKKEKKRQLKKSIRPAKIIPNTVYKSCEQVAVIFLKPPLGTVQISFPEFDKIIDTKQYNETTFTFRVPSLPRYGDVRVAILCNNERKSQCTLKILKPSLTAYECLDFLSQTLGIDPTDKKALDAKLVDLFDKSIPEDGTLGEIMKIQTQDMPFTELVQSDQEIPTLLHFAAKHGLEDLACTIMDTPGASVAFQIENKDGHDPADIAEVNNYIDLAEHLRTHFETNTMVEYIHLAVGNIYTNQDDLEKERSTDSSRSKSLKMTSLKDDIPDEQKSKTLPLPRRPMLPLPSEEEEKESIMSPEAFMGITTKPIFQQQSSLGSTTHEELLEINNAVKNGEFTVDEAHRLYSSWLDRNKAVQSKSLRERQQAIDELRNQYQQVFKPVKQKRESIFSKIMQRVSPRKKSSDSQEPVYEMQISHPTMERERKVSHHGRESTVSNSSFSSGGSRDSIASQSSWRDSSRGSMQEDSDSNSENMEDIPEYNVQRRQSESKEGSENRISLREMFLKQVNNNEGESPTLPPRISKNPPPPRKDRPPQPLPSDQPFVRDPVQKKQSLPPLDRPLPDLPTEQIQLDTKQEQLASPISRRPPAQIPPNPSPRHTSPTSSKAASPVNLPPRPPRKR